MTAVNKSISVQGPAKTGMRLKDVFPFFVSQEQQQPVVHRNVGTRSKRRWNTFRAPCSLFDSKWGFLYNPPLEI